MHERLAPADDVPGRPPELPEGMVGLGDEHRLEAAGAVAVGAEDLQLVQPLHVERERALRAVDLPLERVAAAEREPRRLDRPDRARSRTRRRPRSRRRPAGRGGRCGRAPTTVAISPTRKRARSITWVPRSPSAPEPASSGSKRQVSSARIVAPVLQVAAAEVADLAELAGLDHLAREPHGGDEAVVEAAEVLDAGRLDALPDVVALVGVAAERLLAEDVLAGLGGGDRRLGVERVGAAVVEEPDRRVGDDVVPVGRPALVAVARRPSPRRLPRSGRRSRRAGACSGGGQSCTRSSGTRSSAPCP